MCEACFVPCHRRPVKAPGCRLSSRTPLQTTATPIPRRRPSAACLKKKRNGTSTSCIVGRHPEAQQARSISASNCSPGSPRALTRSCRLNMFERHVQRNGSYSEVFLLSDSGSLQWQRAHGVVEITAPGQTALAQGRFLANLPLEVREHERVVSKHVYSCAH